MMRAALRAVRSPLVTRGAAAMTLAVVAAVAGGAAMSAEVQPRQTILESERGSDWTLRVHVTVRADGTIDPKTKMPNREPLKVDTAAVVFPVARQSASHFTWPGVSGELKVGSRVVDDRPDWLEGYHSGVRLGKWELVDWQGEAITLSVEIPVTAFNTKFDERAAMQFEWPDAWPAEAQSTLQPQMFVDVGPTGPYEMAPVKNLVQQWTQGKDPRSVKPLELAKYFAGQVWLHVQPSGNGLAFNRQGELEGIDLQGAPETARRGQGTEFDMVCLLAAVYREAGLPARTVIGFDVGAKNRDTNAILGRQGSAALRAWVEFALMDEQRNLVWVPVDIVRMRKSSSKPPSTSTWRWFGTHNELDGVIPFAFHFHPPTDVVAHGSPAFWGWMVTPKPPERVLQSIRIDAIRTPKRPSQPRPTGPAGR